MTTYDVSPALKEIREKIYVPIRDYITGLPTVPKYSKGWPDTVVVVGPKQTRRKEDAWYRPSAWLSKRAGALATMSHDKKPPPLDEIVIAGEALALPPRELVEVVLHATIHQALAVYWYISSQRHDLGIYQHVITSTLGLVPGNPIDWSKITLQRGKDLDTLLDQITTNLNEDAFDLSRKGGPTSPAQPSRLKLWMCPSCQKPKIRTGGFLKAICGVCGSIIKYADKDRLDPTERAKIEMKFGSSRVM